MSDYSDLLAAAAAEVGVPGAVLGVLAGGETQVYATGVLSTRTQVPVTTDSVFQIGSVTKVWTATLIAQLVEEGRLTYDSGVAEVLPGVRLGRGDVAGQVTVRQLLSHTSGIDGDVFTDTGRGDDCLERYVSDLAEVEVIHPAGAAYSYCNSGFVVLGRMIEVLDGRSFDASVRARIAEPLDLHDVCLLPEEAILRRAAVGHRDRPRNDEPYDTWSLPRSLAPAGLVTTTAADLLGFAAHHLAGGSTLTAMREPQGHVPNDPALDQIALSWRLGTWDDVLVLGHDGGTIGQTAKLRLVPDHDVAVCLLTNSGLGDALDERVLAPVLEELTGLRMPQDPTPDPDAHPTGIERHAGRYERLAMNFDVSVEGDQLHVEVALAGELAKLNDGESIAFEMSPSDAGGDCFVGRSDPREPWWSIEFGTLPDGRATLFSGGRIALRR